MQFDFNGDVGFLKKLRKKKRKKLVLFACYKGYERMFHVKHFEMHYIIIRNNVNFVCIFAILKDDFEEKNISNRNLLYNFIKSQ